MEMKTTTTKTPTPTPTPESILSLPDDVIISCLARLSRLYYPVLSLVCKRFRSLVASPELYEIRSLLRRTESCLYVCLKYSTDDFPRWFTLYRKPNPFSDRYPEWMIPIPSLCSPIPYRSCLVGLNSDIYKIGGPIGDLPSSSVSILDCRSHKRREAPSLIVERVSPSACVVDGKIYVAGETDDSDSLSSIEVFDSKTQSWDHVPCPPDLDSIPYWGCAIKTACIEGKFHLMYGEKGMVYDPKEGRWDLIEPEMTQSWNRPYCVIDNILYSFDKGVFIWYDTKVRLWKNLWGLAELPVFSSDDTVRLVDHGGKMVILWDNDFRDLLSGDENVIWCAVIAFERSNEDEDEIWGNVEWVHIVLVVPDSYYFVKVLTVTL